ncbi:MAG: DUF885 domain-containing protein [Candidatus Eremiobacteraeota bacterium]|nr:DUF885 domain-containing protein [Candidatus Eremiobacteraeota bacterium]
MDQKLDKLSQNFLNYLMKSIPPLATQIGVHDYDEEMPQGDLKWMEDFMSTRQKFFEDIRAIDPEKLSFDKKIDRGAVLNTFSVQIFEDEAHGRWKSHPQAQELLGLALHTLFIKEFAPFDERIRRIAARLEKTPEFLEKSKELITDPVLLWVKMAANETSQLKGFITLIQKTAEKEGVDEKIRARLNKASESAIEALAGYERWLVTEKIPFARKDFAMGPENFDKFIELRELDMTTDEIYKFGEETLKHSREKLAEVAKKIAPDKTLKQVRKMMMENHPPTFEDVLREGQKAVEESRQFVIDSGYVTLPENEKLHIVETPGFLRELIPFGAYDPPGKFDEKQIGFYYMSPPINGDPSGLEIHNYGSILNTSVHEGYPGHHVQLVCANKNPSYSRMLTQGDEFAEGWAHYCEEAVANMGFCTELPSMFERYSDMAWRAVRIIVDVKLSRGEMTHSEAMDLIEEVAGFDRESCKMEVDRYTFTPGYQLSYLVGKQKIMDLRDYVEKKTGDKFSLRKFHDAMLYAGTLPYKYIEKVVYHAFGLDKVEAGL